MSWDAYCAHATNGTETNWYCAIMGLDGVPWGQKGDLSLACNTTDVKDAGAKIDVKGTKLMALQILDGAQLYKKGDMAGVKIKNKQCWVLVTVKGTPQDALAPAQKVAAMLAAVGY
eukprot:gb/GEZN01016687.1/.p2 GENE.gb/GEZN01016687.1/~~gb/GEZN01016687.1/.p2  ORF type:complete len:116 (+),score=16.42 gb/GEZN01016687.1/:187-534(+)